MHDSRENLGRWTAAALLVVAAFTLMFYRYNSGDLYHEVPAQISVFASRMNAMDTWLMPYLDGSPQPVAPPLYLWMVKIASGLSPDVASYAVRIPSTVSSFLLTLLVGAWLYLHTRRYQRDDGEEPPAEGFGLLAGLMMVSMPLVFSAARMASAGSLFALLYLGAAFCWTESLEARRSFYSGWPWRRWMLLGYALAGLGMLVGGPLVMLLLWIPYAFAAHSYRLHGLDWTHLAGTLIALVLGAWWPLAVAQTPEVDASAFWREWLTFGTGGALMLQWGTWQLVVNLLLGTFPWLLLALLMIARVWRREDRSPTLVYWMWSFVANTILLVALNGRVGSHPLPLAALTAMLATDALFRWNFETGWARGWRIVLRVVLILAMPSAMFICGVINSDVGLVFFVLTAIGWATWAIRSRHQGITFTPWATTVRLVSIAVVVFMAVEVSLLADWFPRAHYHDDTYAYFRRVARQLEDQHPRLYLLADGPSALHRYHLDQQISLVEDVARLTAPEQIPTYLFARRDLETLWETPWLVPLTQLGGECRTAPGEIMFRVLPRSERESVTGTIDRLDRRLPFRLGLIGNTGTRTSDQRDVADELIDEHDNAAFDDIVLLGNNIHGPRVFDHLEIKDSFEVPYHDLLRDGVSFHATLGHEDQSYAWLQTRYPAFHMGGQRYYADTLGMGLVDLFVLDSERFVVGGVVDREQFEWLERELAASTAPWKVVTLFRALLSDVADARVNATLAEALLPLFDRYEVDIVAWASGEWYERLAPEGAGPIFLNLGWSGGVEPVSFQMSPMLQAGYCNQPGFFYADFTVDTMTFRAVDEDGNVVDMGHVSKPRAGGRSVGAVEIDMDAIARALEDDATTQATSAASTESQPVEGEATAAALDSVEGSWEAAAETTASQLVVTETQSEDIMTSPAAESAD